MRIFKAVREQIATRNVRSRQEMSFLPYYETCVISEALIFFLSSKSYS